MSAGRMKIGLFVGVPGDLALAGEVDRGSTHGL
jgi:hypothetical protein